MVLCCIVRNVTSSTFRKGILNQISSSSTKVLYSPTTRGLHCTVPVNLTNTSSHRKDAPLKILRDENIKARRVRLVDPQTNDLMPGPFDTKELLASIDRSRFTLQQVSPGKKIDTRQNESTSDQTTSISQEGIQARSTTITLDDLPIVKLIDKKENYDKQRALRKQKQALQQSSNLTTDNSNPLEILPRSNTKSNTALHKDVLLTWQSSMHDIQHKLQPMRSNIIKRGAGSSCTITVSSKKGKGGMMDMQKKLTFLQELENYLCDWSDLSGIMAESAESTDLALLSKKLPYHPRRRGEIVWQKNERTAILIIEVVRR